MIRDQTQQGGPRSRAAVRLVRVLIFCKPRFDAVKSTVCYLVNQTDHLNEAQAWISNGSSWCSATDGNSRCACRTSVAILCQGRENVKWARSFLATQHVGHLLQLVHDRDVLRALVLALVALDAQLGLDPLDPPGVLHAQTYANVTMARTATLPPDRQIPSKHRGNISLPAPPAARRYTWCRRQSRRCGCARPGRGCESSRSPRRR
jgi:hypothetical protein